MDPTQFKFLFDHWMESFLLILARVLGFTHMGPVFSQTSISVFVRMAISLLLTIIISPIAPSIKTPITSYNFFLSIAINLVVGIFIGFLTKLVLDIAQAAGEIMDHQLGLNSTSLFDPAAGQIPTLAVFFRTLAIVIFMYCGGLEATLITFVKSFELFPLTAIDFSAFHINVQQVIHLTGNIMVIGVIGASPVMIVIVFMDIVLALMSRAAQQINPFSLSFSLKPVVGLLVILLILPFFRARLIEILLEGVKIFN